MRVHEARNCSSVLLSRSFDGSCNVAAHMLSTAHLIGFLQGQLFIGMLPSLANIGVHALIMAALSWAAHRTAFAMQAARARLRLVLVMIAAVSILTTAHLIEIVIWAATYALVGAVPERVDAYYFAFVNYTTLGYGDIVPIERWRLLGPMAAMNGILLFGWSTAVIYDVLRTIAQVIPLQIEDR
jgi:Ion channel